MAEANLCENCCRVLTTWRHWQSSWSKHHTDYDSLIFSLNSGCTICKWLSLQVPAPHDNSSEVQNSFQTFCDFRESTLEHNQCGNVKFRGECSWAAPFDIAVCIYPHEDGSFSHQDASKLNNRNRLPQLTACELDDTEIGSGKSIGIIKDWLHSCSEDHPYCSATPDRTFFPTRVIDVQNVDNGTVVLRDRTYFDDKSSDGTHLTDSPRDYPEYFTLSHRWGDPKLVLQLLLANEQVFRSGIALKELSSTFRDAVTLVHRLGYRYIWIDSLCIIQDSVSKKDWKQEAQTMKHVYGNSFCNISAIRSSHDVSFGLFGKRFVPPRSFYPFSADLELPKGDKNPTGKWNFWLDSLWINEMNKAPLTGRGWVVQERFLTRRIVHFTKSQIYWECLEHCRCEEDPKDQFGLLHLGSHSEVGQQAREYKAALRKIIRESVSVDGRRTPVWQTNEHSWPTLRDCWRIMVSTYSRCDLSYETDRLIAISGVAKKFEEMYVHDRYFDGIWKDGLHTDLLWESNASRSARVVRNTAFAPSWSWASLHDKSVTVPGKNVSDPDENVATPKAHPKFCVTVPTAHQKFGGEPNSCIEFVAVRIRPEGGSDDATALLQSSELDIDCFLHHFKRDAKSKTIEIFDDETLSKKIPNMQKIGEDKLRLDTEELVRRFNQDEDVTGVCIPVQEASEGYGHRNVRCLLLEPDSELRYKRWGTVVGGGFGLRWDTSKRTRITLV